jgi:hypothetical protein
MRLEYFPHILRKGALSNHPTASVRRVSVVVLSMLIKPLNAIASPKVQKSLPAMTHGCLSPFAKRSCGHDRLFSGFEKVCRTMPRHGFCVKGA